MNIMKSFYEGLLNHAYALTLVLCLTPYAPSLIQRNYGNEKAVIYCLIILAVSLMVFGFTYWWVKAGWPSLRPARMAMLCLASLLGLMISISAITGIYRILPTRLYLFWREMPAAVLVGMVMVSAFVDLAFFSGGKKVDI